MIRVLIAEDEPPVLRRTKRLIEHIDPDFCVAATAGDGEEALEKLRAEHIDVLFTDIRMPVMDGMKLMAQAERLYPDCSIVVLSGYQDFAYVSAAIRAQAADYLLKPVSEETLEKLLYKLKEKYTARQQERLQQSVAARMFHMFPDAPPDGLQSVSLHLCLYCAGAMPPAADADPVSAEPDVWQKVSLAGLCKTLGREGILFVQEYMGDTPAERILVVQQAEGTAAAWPEPLYHLVQEQCSLPLHCACLSGTVTVSAIGKTHKKLRRFLAERIVIGQSLYETVNLETMNAAKPRDTDFAEDSDAAMQYADALSGGDIKKSADIRSEMLERFVREGWPQRRVLRFYQRVVTLLESKSHDPGKVLSYRDWFFGAIAMATSYAELQEIVKSLDQAPPADGEGNETIAKVRDYLQANFSQHITGQTLARQFGYVPSYISYLFRQTYGLSPADYLIWVRLSKAKELMRAQPALLVREVAEQVGFKNQYHFSRVFKKNEGLWPTEFKA